MQNRFAQASTLVLSALSTGLASAIHAVEATTNATDPHFALVAAGSVVASSCASLCLNLLAAHIPEAKNEKLAAKNHLLRHGMADALKAALYNRENSSDAGLPSLPEDPYKGLFASWFRLLDEALNDNARLEDLFPVALADSQWDALIHVEDSRPAANHESLRNEFRKREEEHATALADLLRNGLTDGTPGGPVRIFNNQLRDIWAEPEARDFARDLMPFYRAAFDADFSKGGPLFQAFELKAQKQLLRLATVQMQVLSEIKADVGTIKNDVGLIREILEGRRSQSPLEPVIIAGNLDKEIFGRNTEAEKLCDALRSKDTRVVSIAAPPGFGKSAVFHLAVRKTLERKKPTGDPLDDDLTGIAEVDARVTKQVIPAFARLLERITGSDSLLPLSEADEEPSSTVRARFFEYLQRSGRVWLIVDNAEELLASAGGNTHPDSAARAAFRDFLKDWCNTNHSSHLLLLTRVAWHPSPGRPVHRQLMEVEEALRGGLPEDDATTLLRRFFGETRFERTEETLLRQIVRRLHRMPMAIEQFAGYLRTNEAGVSRLDKGFIDRNDLLRLFDPAQSEEFLLMVIREHLKLLDDRARLMLSVLGWAETTVPQSGLLAVDRGFGFSGVGPIQTGQALTTLVRSGLIEQIEGSVAEGLRFQMHALVREAVYDNADAALDLERIGDVFDEACSTALRLYEFRTALLLSELVEKAFRQLLERQNRGDLTHKLSMVIVSRAVALDTLGRPSEAVEAYDSAIAILRRLVEQEGSAKLGRDLAAAVTSRGVALSILGRLTEAVQAYDSAIEILRRLVEQEGSAELVSDLADVIMNRASWLFSLGRIAESLEASDSAIALIVPLVKQVGREGRAELAKSLSRKIVNRANALERLGRLAEAMEAYDAAVAILRSLIDQEGRAELANDLATTITNRGTTLSTLGRLAEAVEAYDEAIVIQRRLVEREGRAELANNLATTIMNRANALSALGRLAEAVEGYDEAVAIRHRLVEQEGQAELANDLAMTIMSRGTALSSLGRLTDAVKAYNAAIAILYPLVAREGRTELTGALARALMNRGNALNWLARSVEAVEDYDIAITILRDLVAQEGQTELANELAMAIMNRGIALGNLGQLAEALEAHHAATAIRRHLVEGEGRAELANDLAKTIVNLGNALNRLGRLAEAVDAYDEAIAIRRRLVDQEGRAELASDLARAIMNRGVALYRLGRPAEAVEAHDSAIAILRRLVEQDGRTELGNDLANAILNRVSALSGSADGEAARVP